MKIILLFVIYIMFMQALCAYSAGVCAFAMIVTLAYVFMDAYN
jgi:hypothetical protein